MQESNELSKISDKSIELIEHALNKFSSGSQEQWIRYIESRISVPEFYTFLDFIYWIRTRKLAFGPDNFSRLLNEYERK